MGLNIFRPPKINVSGRGTFWKQIGMIIIGTTISLVLTIFAAQLMERHQRAKDRHLSAMMVMSNIESFARNADELADYLASADSLSIWLLSKPVDELALMPDAELNSLIDIATAFPFMSCDKSAESIFSNNIETWKNMGNVQFINRVGQCFSTMNSVEDSWNSRVRGVTDAILNIKDHPDDYPGGTVPIKIISNEQVRRILSGTHHLRGYLYHVAATMRYYNRFNMEAIGIEEKEVMDFSNRFLIDEASTADEPVFGDYQLSPLLPDSLTTFSAFDARLDSLVKYKH